MKAKTFRIELQVLRTGFLAFAFVALAGPQHGQIVFEANGKIRQLLDGFLCTFTVKTFAVKLKLD